MSKLHVGVGLPAPLGFLLLSAALGGPAHAADNADKTLETVTVTGSLIKRTDTETPSPVQVISEAQLQQSGLTSISDVLRNVSANGAGTLSQSFNSAFAGGGAGVALRGLSVGATLTLIDGHRMVGYPLTDDGQRNFVDVTSIPFPAVERVEVLKDGASAAYGSDAIAGVVNVILRKTYRGFEASAEGGISSRSDGNVEHYTALAGVGDIATDGWNLWGSAEYRHQDPISFYSRNGAFTRLDWRPYGGLNTTPGAGSNPFGYASSGFPASRTGYLFNPNDPAAAPVYLPGCTAAQQAADQCTFRYDGLQLQPPTQSANLLSKLTFNLGGDWQSVTTASFFQTEAQQASGGGYSTTNYPSGSTIIGLPPGGLPNVAIYPPITVPANYPGNAFGVAAQLVYSFTELGYPYTQYRTNTYRLVQDFNGTVAGWDAGASIGYMYAHLTQRNYGFVAPGALQDALNSGYILGSASGRSLFSPVPVATDTSFLYYGNAHASHPLLSLPGGQLALALGAEWFEKKLNAPAAPESLNGTVAGLNDAYAIGSQADTAVFAELQAPILKNLEANAAVRYDHYNTSAGGSATPKLGIKYTPFEMLALRGTWGRGFRAPSIAENNSGAAFGAGSVPDPVLCPDGNPATPGNFPSQCAVQLVGVQTGNPKLKPEKSTNYTVGFVLEPVKQLSLAVDYWDIKINQDIISAFEAGGLGFGGLTQLQRLGPLVTLPQTQAGGGTAPVQTSVPLITYNAYPYVNASQDETNGIDFDLKSGFDFGAWGKLSGDLSWTHILTFKLEALGTSYELAGTHGPSGVSGDTGNPKDRANLQLTWEFRRFSLSGNVNYIGGFEVRDPSAGQATCDDAVYNNYTLEFGNKYPAGAAYPKSFCHVASFIDVDFYAQYHVTDHIDFHGSIVNAFDRQAPLDVVTYGGGGGGAYSAGLHQAGAVGRFYTVGATLRF